VFFGVPGAFDHVLPPSVETCHWTASTLPVALALKVAMLPATIDWLAGWITTVGGTTTVGVTALVVAKPALFVNTARYSVFASVFVAEMIVRTDVAFVPATLVVTVPAAGVHIDPPLIDCCQAAVGIGLPVAAAVNVNGWPRMAVVATGCSVTTGAVSTEYVTVFDLLAGNVPDHVAL
jgi:hypothetical protein